MHVYITLKIIVLSQTMGAQNPIWVSFLYFSDLLLPLPFLFTQHSLVSTTPKPNSKGYWLFSLVPFAAQTHLFIMTALVVVLVLILAITGGSDATWCVCRSDVSDSTLQKALDYACGAGADCSPVLQNGACYQPNTVRGHCSYAANSYFQRKGQAAGSCDFSGSATITTTDPSYSTCTYPSTASSAGTSGTTPTSTTSNNFTPTGVLGLAPSGNTFSPDVSDGGLHLKAGKGTLFMAMMYSVLALLKVFI